MRIGDDAISLRPQSLWGEYSKTCQIPFHTKGPNLDTQSKKSARNLAAVVGQRRTWLRRRPIMAAKFIADFLAECPN